MGGKPSLFVFWGINQRHQHHHLRIPGWWHQLWWFSASCISRRFLNLAEIIFWEGDQTNQKSDTFFGGGFEGFFFSIFSLDKMIKNWRAYFSNDLKPPTKHRVFSQTCKSLVEIWAMKQRAPELFRLYMGMNSCPVIWAVFRGKNGSFPQVFADLTFLTSMYNQWTLQRHQRMTQTRSALESMNIPKTLIQWLWLIFVSEIYWWMIFDHPYFDGSCRKLEAKKIPVLNWRMLMIRLYYTSIDPR